VRFFGRFLVTHRSCLTPSACVSKGLGWRYWERVHTQLKTKQGSEFGERRCECVCLSVATYFRGLTLVTTLRTTLGRAAICGARVNASDQRCAKQRRVVHSERLRLYDANRYWKVNFRQLGPVGDLVWGLCECATGPAAALQST
jgi:hypothetical protein